jgi:hypothetical protein
MFSPSTNYQILELLIKKKLHVIAQASVEETSYSPNEENRQSIQLGSPNVEEEIWSVAINTLDLRTPNFIANVFGYLN